MAELIFAAHLLNYWDSNLTLIQGKLWKNQLSGSGIKVNYGEGVSDNSTNSETDALTLLAYNRAVISRIQALQKIVIKGPSSLSLILGGSKVNFNLTYVKGGIQNVTIAHGALPRGVKVAFLSTHQVEDGTNVTVIIWATTSARSGTVKFTVKGEDGLVGSIKVAVTVLK